MKRTIVGLMVLTLLVSSLKVSANNTRLILSATPNHAENYIHLDWEMNDNSQPYSYQIQQKREGETEYQTIPAKETAKVLNIYPEIGSNITYTTWDGTTRTLPEAASLEMWMELPNNENPKGYGMGLIDVDQVEVDEFNSNPNAYLKDDNGNYKYDVVAQGFWDNNGGKHLGSQAKNELIKFANTGRGMLVGHDVVNNASSKQWNLEFLDYLNMESTPSNKYITGDDQIYPSKKGLLMNYPWDIREVGEILDIPKTHVSRLFAKGDVWFKYVDPLNIKIGSTVGNLYENENGTNNHYLTTHNNWAMIQTGHSKGKATSDEQKILANTLFYLSQITTDTNWDDYSGQDLANPPKPAIQNVLVNSESNKIEVAIKPSDDLGTTYSYQIIATGENTGEKIISNEVTVTITSGIKGYSYVIDDHEDTIPNGKVNSTDGKIEISGTINENSYLHIQAIDNAGNKSDVTHFKLNNDININLSKNGGTWATGHSTKITATSSHSEISHIEYKWTTSSSFPSNGFSTISNESSVSAPASTGNHYLHVKATDKIGNTRSLTSKVFRIDRTEPTLNLTQNPTEDTNSNVVITARGSDSHSGVKRIRVSGGTWTNGSSMTHTVSSNGTYSFQVEDNAGNLRTEYIAVSNIDKTKPTVFLSPNGGDYAKTHSSKITATDSGSGVELIEYRWTTSVDFPTSGFSAIANNETVNAPTSTGNHYLHVRATDKAGNVTNFTSNVFRIDRTAPTVQFRNVDDTHNYHSRDWDEQDIEVLLKFSDAGSGYKRSRYAWTQSPDTPHDSEWSAWEEKANYVVTKAEKGEWHLHVQAEDNVGNMFTTKQGLFKYNQKPTINLTYTPTKVFEGDTVTLTAVPSDKDGDLMTVILEVFVDDEWQLLKKEENVETGQAVTLDIRVTTHEYIIRATAIDDTEQSGEDQVSFNPIPLEIKGFVSHTPDWKAIHEANGHDENQYFAGEVFKTKAVVTNHVIDSVTVEFIGEQINNETLRFTEEMFPNPHPIYIADVFKEDMGAPDTRLKTGPVYFVFTVKWQNGIVKQDMVQVNIFDGAYNSFNFHRTN